MSGSAGLDDLSGPVGIVSTIKDVGEEAQEAEKNNQNGFAAAAESILYFGALIAVNLAVMNLLPLPALDGGKCVPARQRIARGALQASDPAEI